MLEELTRHRRALHRIPEIGFDLPQTHAYVLDALSRTSAALETVALSGVAAFFDAGKPDTVAFRSDMDALTVQEAVPCAFSSTHPGRMHACGHDAHMAILLTFAGWVERRLHALPVNVLLLFQPAEESGGGGRTIVDSGVLERCGVRRIFALHVDPDLPGGALASRPGPMMAQTAEIHADFFGKSAHCARAEMGRDALMAAARFVTRCEDFERALPEDMLRLLKFGTLAAGTAQNAIADRAGAAGTVRAYSDAEHRFLADEIRKIGQNCAEDYGVRAEIAIDAGYPALRNDPAVYAMARSALSDLDFRELARPELIAEDFSFYLQRVPGLMLKLGIGTGIALHSPHFTLDERTLTTGVEAFKRLAQMPIRQEEAR